MVPLVVKTSAGQGEPQKWRTAQLPAGLKIFNFAAADLTERRGS